MSRLDQEIHTCRALVIDGNATSRSVLCSQLRDFGVEVERAEYALETLVDAHLLESPSPERYRFHDLIKLYAAEPTSL